MRCDHYIEQNDCTTRFATGEITDQKLNQVQSIYSAQPGLWATWAPPVLLPPWFALSFLYCMYSVQCTLSCLQHADFKQEPVRPEEPNLSFYCLFSTNILEIWKYTKQTQSYKIIILLKLKKNTFLSFATYCVQLCPQF